MKDLVLPKIGSKCLIGLTGEKFEGVLGEIKIQAKVYL